MKIRQESLRTYLATEQEIRSMKAQLAQLEEERDKLQGELIPRLDAGDGVAAGTLDAEVVESYRVNVPWRKAFEGRCGQEEAEAVVAQTAPTVYRRLAVSLR